MLRAMPSIALLTDDGRLVAMVSIAGNAALDGGPPSRGCTILPVPTDAALLDEPLMAAIEPWLNDELGARVIARDRGGAIARIALGAEEILVVELDDDGRGAWRLDPGPSATGRCRIA
jgi:hypothetical protein